MSKVIKPFLFFVLFATEMMFAQGEKAVTPHELSFNRINNSEIYFSGNLHIDNKLSFDAVKPEYSRVNLNPESKDEKSPWLGALFSFVLPGAGEVYAESYWKAGIFVVIEAAVVTTAIVYNNKGNEATDVFENYANQNWSPVKYAKWLNKYRGGNITINENPSLPPWQQVSFAEINQVENLPENSDLSHNLAPYGEQQYYEMIGKYDQFASGWDDFSLDQSTTQPISTNFKYYSGLRADANNYYSIASTAVIGIYINHFLSAIDAYWSTTVYNKELVAKITVETNQFADVIELVPTLNIKFSF